MSDDHPYGEIEARDETIRLLERKLAAAEADAARLAEAAGEVTRYLNTARIAGGLPASRVGALREALASHTARLIDG